MIASLIAVVLASMRTAACAHSLASKMVCAPRNTGRGTVPQHRPSSIFVEGKGVVDHRSLVVRPHVLETAIVAVKATPASLPTVVKAMCVQLFGKALARPVMRVTETGTAIIQTTSLVLQVLAPRPVTRPTMKRAPRVSHAVAEYVSQAARRVMSAQASDSVAPTYSVAMRKSVTSAFHLWFDAIWLRRFAAYSW